MKINGEDDQISLEIGDNYISIKGMNDTIEMDHKEANTIGKLLIEQSKILREIKLSRIQKEINKIGEKARKDFENIYGPSPNMDS